MVAQKKFINSSPECHGPRELFPKLGVLFRSPSNNDHSVLGSVFGSPVLGNSYIPNLAIVSDISIGPQNDIGGYLGLYITRLGVPFR